MSYRERMLKMEYPLPIQWSMNVQTGVTIAMDYARRNGADIAAKADDEIASLKAESERYRKALLLIAARKHPLQAEHPYQRIAREALGETVTDDDDTPLPFRMEDIEP